ncbi:LacI family DNA-binding transcriptional regulator [Pararhizobium sp.]|uniref:LacI family DNA-binding transcriptional regulator n=1 Tax=Pararhizobium sp. TaxID=1977563 RepID=UPI00271B5E8E|nr:substrate-binding domain-containing protein [Pararhizobium sp.]MDO9416399.1 substrate-binding domain-containing protein [Pararhizobium sp.]
MNLKQFAELLGLSQTTVSRALRGYPEVNEATRKRIEEAAVEHGYHPNRSATGLATGRAGAVGLVLRSEEYNPLTSELLGGLGVQLENEGMDVVLCTVRTREAELAVYRRLAASKRIDAVVLHSPTREDDRVSLLHQLKIPFVCHGRSSSTESCAYVDIDNVSVTQRAVDHLLDLGHRRIGLINGVEDRTYAMHRDRGYRDALAARDIAADRKLVAYGEFTDENGYDIARVFLGLKDPPTAIVAGSMMSTLGAMRAIRAANLTIGQDVSIVAHDDVFFYLNADKMTPAISATRSSIRAAGARVAEFIVQLLNGKDESELQEVWPVEFVLRESTRPCRPSTPQKK